MKPFWIAALSTLLYVFLWQVANAQTYPYYHYTTDHGLPHSNVYCMAQDHNGFIWFGTENGLSRFDGTQFKNFSEADGLTANEITGMGVTQDSTLWLAIYDKDINYLKDGLIGAMQLQEEQRLFFPDLIEKEDVLYSYNRDRLILVYPSAKQVLSIEVPDSILLTTVYADREGKILLGTTNGLWSFEQQKLTPVYLLGEVVFSITQDSSGELWVGTEGGLFSIDPQGNTVEYSFDIPKNASISKVLADSKGCLWYWYSGVENNENGLFLLEEGRVIPIGERLGIDKTQINFIKEDIQGNIWIGTFGQGVFCLHDRHIINYSVKDGLNSNYIFSLGVDPAQNILAGSFKGLNVIKDYQLSSSTDMHPKVLQRQIPDFNGDRIFLTAELDNGQEQRVDENGVTYWYIQSSALLQWSADTIVVGGWNSIAWYLISSQGLKLLRAVSLETDKVGYVRVNKLFRDSKGQLWVATNQGLGLWEHGGLKFLESHAFFKRHVYDIKEGPEKALWVTGSQGIAIREKGQWRYLRSIDNLPLYSVRSIVFDDRGHCWIGTMNGLYNYDGQTVRVLTRQTGLLSSSISALYYDSVKQDIWVGSSDGLSCVDLEKLYAFEEQAPKLIITEVINNKRILENPTNITVSPDDRRLKVHYVALNYSKPRALTYAYRLGKYHSWTTTTENNLEVASLPFGEHQLELRVKEQNGFWSSPIVLPIKVLTPFWRSNWFYLLLFCTITGATVVIVRIRIKAIRTRERASRTIREKIAELEHKAVAALMNPHFIFNSLNTIQFFLNKNLLERANIYLSSFGQLIRIHLDVVERGIITLNEEINRLTLYLDLEKIRFRDKLDYVIEVDPSLNIYKTTMPNMIIQPFVENAIKHGILPADYLGKIHISFGIEQKQILHISIKDNGIGIENRDRVELKDRSHGIAIVEERLRLLFPDHSQLIEIDALEPGTSVVLRIPYNVL